MFGQNEKKEWKSLLGNEDEEKLNSLIRDIIKYREAYSKADNVKMAQLWCALLDAKKQQEQIDTRLARLEDVFRLAGERVRETQQVKESLDKF